ncbi:hypothetical protein JB92DRAFT_3136263 [Gautieria morchelliformis]|nr:hypothetical protein JB92DRAFT_3136263 [Gautieria morchelliformis]
MEEHGFVDHPHKRYACLPCAASKPEEALGEPAGAMDSDAEDHVDAKEAWMKLLSTSLRNPNETFTSSLIATPEKPRARMHHAPNVGPLQPIGNIQANGPLLLHPSQRTEPTSPQGSIQPVPPLLEGGRDVGIRVYTTLQVYYQKPFISFSI